MRVKALVATTAGVPKYANFQLTREALEGMARALRSGAIPMVWNHDASQPLDARVVDAAVVEVEDGHHAVQVEFETEPETWNMIRSRFDAAGVVGGMSFRATATQQDPSGGRQPQVVLAADAAAWTDEDRSAAAAVLDAVVPTRVDLLFEYSAEEIATVVIFLAGNVGLGILGNAAYEAVKQLLFKRGAETRIEVRRDDSDDGPGFAAVVTTKDPDVAREALRQLAAGTPKRHLEYDARRDTWREVGDGSSDDDD